MSEFLNPNEIEQFVQNGFIRIDDAFSKEISNAVLDTLFELAIGRDATLKSKSLDIIVKLSGVVSVMRLTDPLVVN